MAASPNLHVLVLRDTNHGPAAIWSIDETHVATSVKDMGEVDMGDAGSFRSFAQFAKANFPAERYVVAYYNHGSGWEGACNDDTSQDTLSMEEIRSGLSELGHVDVVLFTAPCLMGALESVYELRDLADIYVGSENLSGYMWWFGIPGWIRDTLTVRPDISTVELGQGIVQKIAESSRQNCTISPEDCETLTMSAVRPDLMPELNGALNSAIQEMRVDLDATWNGFDAVATAVQSYANGYDVDLFDLLDRTAAANGSRLLRARISAVENVPRRATVAEAHGTDNPGSHGLTIVFPKAKNSHLPPRYHDSSYHLDFATDSLWDELMMEYDLRPGASFSPRPELPRSNGLYPRSSIRLGTPKDRPAGRFCRRLRAIDYRALPPLQERQALRGGGSVPFVPISSALGFGFWSRPPASP